LEIKSSVAKNKKEIKWILPLKVCNKQYKCCTYCLHLGVIQKSSKSSSGIASDIVPSQTKLNIASKHNMLLFVLLDPIIEIQIGVFFMNGQVNCKLVLIGKHMDENLLSRCQGFKHDALILIFCHVTNWREIFPFSTKEKITNWIWSRKSIPRRPGTNSAGWKIYFEK
jgi:hypothetical protein